VHALVFTEGHRSISKDSFDVVVLANEAPYLPRYSRTLASRPPASKGCLEISSAADFMVLRNSVARIFASGLP